jgi:hypothetical protein
MDYPWWTISFQEAGFHEETEIHCVECALEISHALGHELNDFEINQLRGVRCGRCGREWKPIHIPGFACECHACLRKNYGG